MKCQRNFIKEFDFLWVYGFFGFMGPLGVRDLLAFEP